jgi:hypothetical protein
MPIDTRDWYKNRRRTYRKTGFRLWRTIIGIVASFILMISVAMKQPSLVTVFAGSAFAVPAFGFGILGSIVSYWKRRFGAILILIGALFGLGLIPFGGWAVLGLLMLAFCIVSAYWHVLPD